MYKYAFFATLLLIISGTSHAQQNNPCQGQTRTCKKGSPTCTLMQAMPGGPISGHALLCFEDGEAPPPQLINNQNDDDQKTPTCPAGKILANGKCIDPCLETKVPTQWDRILADMNMRQSIKKENKNTASKQIFPLPAGPTTGLSNGIVAGDEDTCKRTPKYEAYAKCLTDTDPQRIAMQSGRWITDAKILNEKRAEAAQTCATSNGYKSTTEAGKDHNKCLNGSVIDTVWGFLTHKRIY